MPGQRLLKDLDLFGNLKAVLDDPKFRTPGFARRFIEAWDDVSYVDPHAGMRLANVAVKLVELLEADARRILRPRALARSGAVIEPSGISLKLKRSSGR